MQMFFEIQKRQAAFKMNNLFLPRRANTLVGKVFCVAISDVMLDFMPLDTPFINQNVST